MQKAARWLMLVVQISQAWRANVQPEPCEFCTRLARLRGERDLQGDARGGGEPAEPHRRRHRLGDGVEADDATVLRDTHRRSAPARPHALACARCSPLLARRLHHPLLTSPTSLSARLGRPAYRHAPTRTPSSPTRHTLPHTIPNPRSTSELANGA
eukprot:6190513-Pleurochrysis_carterae.AAC.5